MPSPERHALLTSESGGEILAPRSVHALEPVCHSYTSTYEVPEFAEPTSRREPSSEKDKALPGLSTSHPLPPLLVNVAPIWVHEALRPCPAISRAVDLPERRRKTATHSHRVRVARGSAVEFCLVSVMSGSRCSSVTCGVGGGRVGLAAGRGEETHGDAVAKPPKSGIARKATEAVGARGLARFGDAETCARDLRPPLGGRRIIRALPQGREGNQKTWGSDTRASDAPRRVSGFCGWGVGASRAFVARGRISGAGEARVSGLGLAGDCVSSVAKRWPKVAERIFFCHVFLDGNGICEPCRREQRGFRLAEKIIGHVQNVIKPDRGVVRLSQTNLRLTAGADAAAFSFITRARLSPATPTRAGHPAETRSSASSSKGDFEPRTSHAHTSISTNSPNGDTSPWASAARR